MKIISIKTDKSGISIRVPRTLLNHVAKHHPEGPLNIINSHDFMEEVAEQLKDNNFDGSESGITSFQELLDKAILEVVSNGSEAIEFKYED